MKKETKKRIWAEVVETLNRGELNGKSYKLSFNHDHEPLVEIFNGDKWGLPPAVIDQLTGTARELIDAEAKIQADKYEAVWQKHKAAEEALDQQLNSQRHKRLYGLAGYYVEDFTGPIFTLAEMEEYLDWARYIRLPMNLEWGLAIAMYDGPYESEFKEVCKKDFSDRYWDYANGGPPYWSFSQIVDDARAYVEKRKSDRAENN